ncbi:MAG: hypothetical protein QM685_00400 [Paraburkholderia sp.]
MRADLVGTIEALAALELWPKEYRDGVLTRAICGPLADLAPNHHYFTERTIKAECDVMAAQLRDERTWHGEGLDDRMSDRKPDTKARRTKARGMSTLDRQANHLRKEATPHNERRRT